MGVYFFTYLLSHDTGFAPCYDNGKFTLACCKPRIRKSVFGKLDDSGKLKDDVWVIGAKHNRHNDNGIYKSYVVYLARITKVLRFEDYYTEDNLDRADCIYHNLSTNECEKAIKNKLDLDNMKVKKTRIKGPKNPHFCKTDSFRKDISGLCVLYSDDFYYFGNGKESHNPIFNNVFERCKKKKPGDFFYAEIDGKKLCKVLKQFEDQGLKNRKSIKPLDKDNTCKD